MPGEARGRKRTLWYGEGAQRSLAPDFAANYRANLRDRTLASPCYKNGARCAEATDKLGARRIHLAPPRAASSERSIDGDIAAMKSCSVPVTLFPGAG